MSALEVESKLKGYQAKTDRITAELIHIHACSVLA